MTTEKKEQLLENILDFQIPEEYFSELSESEIEDFNAKMFSNLISRIIHKLSEDLKDEHLEKVTEMLKTEKTPAEIIKFSVEKSENGLEKIGQEVINFTEEIYHLTN